jgi:hypothetical protein
MNRAEVIERLRACADDPMWANHAEVNKATLRTAVALLEADATETGAGRAVASWKKAAANMVAHWKANGPTVEAQWCTHAAQLLSMGAELMPHGVTGRPAMPPEVAEQFSFFRQLATDPAYYKTRMGKLLDWLTDKLDPPVADGVPGASNDQPRDTK